MRCRLPCAECVQLSLQSPSPWWSSLYPFPAPPAVLGITPCAQFVAPHGAHPFLRESLRPCPSSPLANVVYSSPSLTDVRCICPFVVECAVADGARTSRGAVDWRGGRIVRRTEPREGCAQESPRRRPHCRPSEIHVYDIWSVGRHTTSRIPAGRRLMTTVDD